MVYKISEKETRSITAFRMVMEKVRAVSVKFLQRQAQSECVLCTVCGMVLVAMMLRGEHT